jgi:hypothetical protein
MHCDKIKTLINRDLDGRTTPEERTTLEDHAKACGACASILAADRRIQVLLRAEAVPGAGVDAAPAGLADRVMGRIGARSGAGPTGRLLGMGRWGRRRAAAAVILAAGLLAGGSAGYLAGRSGGTVHAAGEIDIDTIERTLMLNREQSRAFREKMQGFERRREEISRDVAPRYKKIDDEERAALWDLLTADQKKRCAEIDPDLARRLREAEAGSSRSQPKD